MGCGPVPYRVRVCFQRDSVHAAVSVADRGRGIPADLLLELFRKFS